MTPAAPTMAGLLAAFVIATASRSSHAVPADVPAAPSLDGIGAQPLEFGAPFAFDAFDRRRDAPINEEPNYRSDGVYGRFDGELSLVPSVGLQRTSAGWFTQLGIAGFYLNTIGFTFRTADGRWSPVAPRGDFNVSSLALALRPLFLLRWSQDWERGPSFLDLTIDSLTFSIGSYWSQKHSVDTQRYGMETELSFGCPLFARANGPWLTANATNRWPKVTNAGNSVDMAYGLRFEWAFSIGN